MKHSLFVLATVLAAAACGGKSKPAAAPAPTPAAEPAPAEVAETDPIMIKMVEYKDSICACHDQACLDAAEKQIGEWAMAHIDELQAFSKNQTPAQKERESKLDGEVEACKVKAAGTSGEPPLADGVGADVILTQLGGYADQMCACKDQACVDKVEKDTMEWAMKNMEQLQRIKPTEAQNAEGDKISARMDGCKARFAPKP
jgi:hypothetical protein